MKQATEKLSKGDFSVRLQVKGEDELAQLGKAIQTLARDLEYLKKKETNFSLVFLMNFVLRSRMSKDMRTSREGQLSRRKKEQNICPLFMRKQSICKN